MRTANSDIASPADCELSSAAQKTSRNHLSLAIPDLFENLMITNRSQFLIAITCFFFTPILMAAEESDDAKIQGNWLEVEAHILGKPSERAIKSHTFSKGKLVQHYRKPKVEPLVVRYRIDEKAKPRRLDLLYPDPFNPGQWLSYEGIYKLDGNTMIWCQSLTGFPPEDFDPDENNIVLKLKRHVVPKR